MSTMTQSQELRQEINRKNKKLGVMLQKLAEEKRTGYTDEERTAKQALMTEIEAMEERAADAEFQEKRAATAAKKVASAAAGGATGDGEKRNKKAIARQFQIGAAIGAMLRGEVQTGLEAEMRQEAAKEARSFGKSVEGVAIPSFLVATERRDSTVGGSGGNTVPTITEDYEPVLRPMPKVLSMGARLRSGLTGNWEMPAKSAATAATWEGEIDASTETDPTYAKVSMSPHRLAAFTEVSRQLMIQSIIPGGVEADIREDLSDSIALALDLAAISGSGSGAIPTGIINTAGIGSVAIGTDGGAPTRDHLVALQKAIAVENGMVENMGFLTNPDVATKLMTTKVDAGSGLFILEDMMAALMGYSAGYTTQVPNNLTKGTASAICSAIIFGDWSKLILGQWGGVDIIVDQYTKATDGMVRLVANSYYDVAVRQPKAFSAILDATTT